MCNLAGKVFIDPKKGRSDKDGNNVVITNATCHNEPGIRISMSDAAVKMIGQGVDRIVCAAHPDYRNRLYFYDAKLIDGCVGYKLTKSGTRRSFRISTNNLNFDLLKTIGNYSFERDKYNDIFITLNTSI